MGTNVRRQLDGNYQNYLRRVLTDGGTYEQIPTVQFIDQYNKLIACGPSMVVFPSSKKPGTLYTILPNSSSGDFTVTRASSGSYFDRNGVLRLAVANEPRLDYDPVTRQFRGVLVEPSATNRHLGSQTMATGMITFANGGAAAPTRSAAIGFTDPQGLENAVLITGGSGSVGQWAIYRLVPNDSFISGSTICGSVFVKAGNHGTIQMNYANVTGIGTQGSSFDTINGTTPTAGASIQNCGNGWYRCIMAPLTLTVNAGGGFNIGIYITPNTSTTTWNTDYTGKTIYFWGIQVENSSVATSYIPTTTTTASRAADVITRTGASSLIGQDSGSVYLEVFYQRTSEDSQRLDISDGTLNNRIHISFEQSVNTLSLFITRQGVTYVSNSSITSIANNTTYKILVSYTPTTVTVFVNGTRFAMTTQTFTAGSVYDQIRFGQIPSNLRYLKNVKFLALYTRALDDASAIELTRL